jgi:TetR/AcrR family transcriptional regulator, mexJK operon transcriptional repressor
MLTDLPARKGRKIDQVLQGARAIFLRDGYDRASVDDIARAAGVSKATLYAYFPDKRLMFLEICRAECLRQTADAEASFGEGMTVREMLAIAADRIAAYMMSDYGQRMFRIVVAESERFPGIGEDFYRTGPGYIHDRLVWHFRHHVQAGSLTIDDLDLAADQFMQLCKAMIHEKLLFGMATAITQTDIARSSKGAVDMFMARYGAGD